MLSKSAWMAARSVASLTILALSAKRSISVECPSSGKILIKPMKSKGFMGDPCTTPEVTANGAEIKFL